MKSDHSIQNDLAKNALKNRRCLANVNGIENDNIFYIEE